jgi:hypothetical protein
MPLPDHWLAYFHENRLHNVYMNCPHCERPSTFAVTLIAHETVANVTSHHAILHCNSVTCRKRTYVITTKNAAQRIEQDRHNDSLILYPSAQEPTHHTSIPKPIGKDWIEAQKTFNVGATKATAMICRRILYGVILDKKCPEHPLHEGIKHLCAKERLPSIVEKWLGEIKDDGHDAAHPSRALDVSDENVVETMGYTKELLRFVYIEPYELNERLARKAATTESTPASTAATGAK